MEPASADRAQGIAALVRSHRLIEGSTEVRRLSDNVRSETWVATAQTGPEAVTIRVDRDASGAHRHGRHAAALILARTGGVNAPRFVMNSPCAGEVDGLPVFVTSFIPGRSVDMQVKDGRFSEFMTAFGETVAKMHAIERRDFGSLYPVHPSECFGSWDEFALQQTTAFEAMERRVPTARPMIDLLRSGIERAVPPSAASLIHRDLHLPNLVRCRDGSLALIDFEQAQFGDPAADFVYLLQRLDPRWHAAFFSGYRLHRPWNDTDDDRVALWQLIFGLSGVALWEREGRPELAADALSRAGEAANVLARRLH